MFEQTFKNIDDILYKDAGADSELDYIEQTSWVLFLRYLDQLESEKADEAALEGRAYQYILDEQFRWPNWAMPKTADGKLDHHKAMTGPDLVQYVDNKLFPYLASFKQKAIDNPKTIEYKIGEIFSELKNKVKSGYNLREIIEMVDELPFGSSKDKHELSHLYETKIKNMGNAGRNGGQYYTPRPLIRAMIEVVNPQIGEKVYDAACGSAGFLCEAYAYMYERMEKTTKNLKILQEETFYGKEKKNLAYIIGVMNMILHGIEAPNIIHTNTLTENIRDIQEKDRYHVILANPPFGGKERKEVQQNFDIKTSETAFLFLQHFIKSLKAGGRAGIVIKNTFLSNTDNASISLRKYLLESCNLHTILDMPGGTFLGAGVKTVVLFFTKGEPTQKIWYYQLDPGRTLGKTNPLNDADMQEFIQLQKEKTVSEKSWIIDIADIDTSTYDLSVKNPNKKEEVKLRSPQEILAEMEMLDKEAENVRTMISRIIGLHD
ncbi:N-6 DNA methylase [Sphingobacterium sp. T2]|uniref:class I SAM-dependent DNA methyltransferase n=1 Tax=Sphingobacterium sp. T2 TaxID=1590596 RepID=UPI00057BBEE7|nr:N-6 DNA methylase [Sphingobacterium sp. T2]